MRLNVWRQDMAVTPSLRRYVERRVGLALGRFRSRIGHIMVRLADLNGPRGGTDKRCRIVLSVAGLGEVAADATDSSLPAAITVAADRAARVVAHCVSRRQARRHGREFRHPRASPWCRQNLASAS